ncbi:MAG: hypothetical protein L3J71_13095 [Victivallaceae bacterium]|nr:hypothetical protein [Victivallaceae bacterium]
MKNYLMAGILSVALLGTLNAQDQVKQGAGKSKPISFNEKDYADWKAGTVEVAVATVKDGGITVLSFKVAVDHKKDGKGRADGKYLKGWPRMIHYIKPVVDMNKYKELRFEYKISSNRKNVEKTPIYANFNSGAATCTYGFDAGKEDGKWHTKVILIKDIIAKSKKPASDWKTLRYIQFGLSESLHEDGTKLDIKLKNIVLQ